MGVRVAGIVPQALGRDILSSMRWFLLLLVLFLPVVPLYGDSAEETEMSAADLRRLERVDRFLLESMRTADLDAWIILTREGNFDPLSEDFGVHLGRGGLIFLDRGGDRVARVAVITSLDLVPLRQSGIFDEIVPLERRQSFEEVLSKVLDRELSSMKRLERIGINRSESSGIADGLSATYDGLLRRALGPERSGKLVSAEVAVMSFRSKKLDEEIEIYRRGVAVTHEILHEAFTGGFIIPGRTTQAEVHGHVQELAARRGYTELAWEADGCPGVYSGLFSDLSHAEPGVRVIMPGDILWIDFGIRIEGLATDMIRAGYVLREGETEPPEEVRAMFATLLRANRAAVAAMRPGAKGWEVDAAAREIVTAAGYPEFFHSTGHPVGREAHGAGPSLGPKGVKYGSAVELELEQGQIFAVEPSVMLRREEEDGAWIINVEEEVLVTSEGAVYLSAPQEELYLLRAISP